MIANWNLKKPPKRKIPKGRVSRKHHYVMKFPSDLLNKPAMVKCYGFAYTNFWDSFLEDCHNRMYYYVKALPLSELDKAIYTACLN